MKKAQIFLAVLLSLLYFRCAIWITNAWLNDPYYSHGFLVLFVSAFIAWRNTVKHKKEHEFKLKPEHEREYALENEPFKPGIFIFGFGLILYLIGFIKIFPLLAAFSFLFTTSGLILYFYGKTVMHRFLFPISFLIFAIPLPFLVNVAHILQSLPARYSTLLIGALGIPVTRLGAQIHLQNTSVTIGLPCSGMNTLISLLALAAIFIYILKCPIYKKAALFCISIPIAIGANILRITAILLIAHQYGSDAAMKFFHDFSNLFLFVFAFAFLILISIIIGCKLRSGAQYGVEKPESK